MLQSSRSLSPEDRLHAVARASAAVGAELLEGIGRTVAEVIGTDMGFLCERIAPDSTVVAVRSMWLADHFAPAFKYDTVGRPCAQAIAGHEVFEAHGVGANYPDDGWLTEIGADSYLAVPVIGAAGAVVGHLGVMDAGPLERRQSDVDVLELLAARAGTELERIHLEADRDRAREEVARLLDARSATLRRGQQHLDFVLEQIPAVMWSVDEELRFTATAGGGLKVLGLQADDLLSVPVTEYFGTDDPSFPAIRAVRAAVQLGEGSTFEQEWQGRVWRTRVEPLHDGPGVIVGCVGISYDDTEQTRMQEALERALEREQAATEAFRQADRAKNEFLAVVTHELRTPLVAISGIADLLRLPLSDDPTMSQLLKRLTRNADETVRMIDQLLASSRLHVGALAVHPEATALRGMVTTCLEDLEHLIVDHVLVVEVPDDLVVMADPALCRHVIGNLVANAVSYSTPHTRITITARRAGDMADIAVSDEGPGIPPHEAERVFDRFYRLSRGRPGHRGTGLGLSIARQVVELHGGSIWVESEPGKGSSFHFTVPLAPPGGLTKT